MRVLTLMMLSREAIGWVLYYCRAIIIDPERLR